MTYVQMLVARWPCRTPFCLAKPGSPCRTRQGSLTQPHQSRWDQQSAADYAAGASLRDEIREAVMDMVHAGDTAQDTVDEVTDRIMALIRGRSQFELQPPSALEMAKMAELTGTADEAVRVMADHPVESAIASLLTVVGELVTGLANGDRVEPAYAELVASTFRDHRLTLGYAGE